MADKNYNDYKYHKLAIAKYMDKTKKITLMYTLNEYNSRILPAIEESGLKVATYIKQAVNEKIENDQKKNHS